jgi:hypothetical protein
MRASWALRTGYCSTTGRRVGTWHGTQGIRKFCRQQTVVSDRFGANSEINWYPMTARKAGLIRRVMSLYRSGWCNKLRP